LHQIARSLLAAAAVATAAQAASPAPSGAEREIRSLLAGQAAAWSRGDLDAFCAVYAADATFVSPSGVSKGREVIRERYRKKYPGKSGMGALTLEVQEVRLLGEAAAVVGRWTLTWPDKPAATGSTALVLQAKKDGSWEIVQDASM